MLSADTRAECKQPNGSGINVIFSDKQHNYSLISISEWPLCLCERTDGPIVGSRRLGTLHADNNTLTESSSALMQSDWVILMKLSSQFARQGDRWRRKKRKKPFLSSHYCLFSSTDLWPSDRKEHINGKTWTFHEPDGSDQENPGYNSQVLHCVCLTHWCEI